MVPGVSKVGVSLGAEHSLLTCEAVLDHVHVREARLGHAQLRVEAHRALRSNQTKTIKLTKV
jgi:hypothetical protein